jgi:hypothetical protein
VFADVDLRSSKRIVTITPNVFDDVYDYTAPTDIKGYGIIDVRPQAGREIGSKIKLVSSEFFDRKKSDVNLLAAIEDDDFARKLRLNIDVNDDVTTVSDFGSTVSPSGTWGAFGDAANVIADTDNYVEGSGSLKFDLVGSGATAGVVNSALTAIDISDYVNAGSALVWVYINSTTNLTNWILRIGSDSSNYYSITVTTQHDSTAFRTGWNLLRFAFVDKSTTGAPVDTACDYCALYMTKSAAKSDDGYRVDNLELHTGEIYEIVYYTKYPWQNTSATYLENSSSATDYINADTDEFDLIVMKGKVEMYRELRDYEQMKLAQVDYENMKRAYKRRYKSEALIMQDSYY